MSSVSLCFCFFSASSLSISPPPPDSSVASSFSFASALYSKTLNLRELQAEEEGLENRILIPVPVVISAQRP